MNEAAEGEAPVLSPEEVSKRMKEGKARGLTSKRV